MTAALGVTNITTMTVATIVKVSGSGSNSSFVPAKLGTVKKESSLRSALFSLVQDAPPYPHGANHYASRFHSGAERSVMSPLKVGVEM